MRQNGFNGGSFLLGLLVGFVLLAIIFFAAFYPSNRPASTAYYTATPEAEGTPLVQVTPPVVPVTGGNENETGNPVKLAFDNFIRQIDIHIIQPILAWLNGRPIIIQTNPPSKETPIVVTATP